MYGDEAWQRRQQEQRDHAARVEREQRERAAPFVAIIAAADTDRDAGRLVALSKLICPDGWASYRSFQRMAEELRTGPRGNEPETAKTIERYEHTAQFRHRLSDRASSACHGARSKLGRRVMQSDLFQPQPGGVTVAVDDTILDAIRGGAWVVFNLSGGKDSTATSHGAIAQLDALGHPRDRRIAIHADLGRAEWKSTPRTVERCAEALGLPLFVVRRSAGDMVQRWEVRFTNALARYEALETYNLIGPWSQANKRFCTAELKAQVIGPELARRYRGETIIQVMGIRREESTGRKNAPISKLDTRFAKPGNRHGTRMLIWHPGVHWTKEQVFACHARHNLPLHEAYTRYGSSRLSCAFCVLGSIADLRAAASAAGNADLWRHLVGMEANSTFSFQPEQWLADVAPKLLTPGLAGDVERAKRDCAKRREIEAGMPAGLRYVKGWPPRLPTGEEAQAIVAARWPILRRHGLEERYGTGRAVIDRFAELMARPRP